MLVEFKVEFRVKLNEEMKPVEIEAVLPDGRSIKQDLSYDHALNLEDNGFIQIIKEL